MFESATVEITRTGLELAQLRSIRAPGLPKFELLLCFTLLSRPAEPLKVTPYPAISVDPNSFFFGWRLLFSKLPFRPKRIADS